MPASIARMASDREEYIFGFHFEEVAAERRGKGRGRRQACNGPSVRSFSRHKSPLNACYEILLSHFQSPILDDRVGGGDP